MWFSETSGFHLYIYIYIYSLDGQELNYGGMNKSIEMLIIRQKYVITLRLYMKHVLDCFLSE